MKLRSVFLLYLLRASVSVFRCFNQSLDDGGSKSPNLVNSGSTGYASVMHSFSWRTSGIN